MIREKISKFATKFFIKAGTNSFYRVSLLFTYVAIMFLSTDLQGHAAGGNIMTNFNNMIDDAKGQIVTMSTAAAGVGVGTGTFMKKFSMGRGDRIESGNKLIKDSVIGWGTINSITAILAYLKPFTSGG